MLLRKTTTTGKRDIYLTITPKETSTGIVYFVVDKEGYICGLFDNEFKAKRAIPKIKRNLYKGRVAPQTLRPLRIIKK